MKKLISVIIILILISAGCGNHNQNVESIKPGSGERLSRKDSFLGFHFDLHASEEDSLTGATLTEGLIDSLLTAVKPDYIQVDCKGHPGISSYPTEVGFQTSGYNGDPLARWRKVTAEHGVALYMHFSGIYDMKVASQFPEWAVVHADGSKSEKVLSVFSPYDDTYLIPQLKELAGKYKVDGVWVDGECWAYEADYSKKALDEFTKRTGTRNIPRKPGDQEYFNFIEYQRELFREHVAHYLEKVHAEYPDFQITSNWAFSSMMPEPVSLDLDYLSGDLTPGNAVNRAAFESRCLAGQGMPWDLMAWSFSWDPGRDLPNSTKSALQLNQELAEVMAMGGGVQVYFRQNSDISFQPWTISIMKEIAEFARARQPWCKGVKPVPQSGILYSGYGYKQNFTGIYGAWGDFANSLIGTNTAVLDGQYCTEILMEHHLAARGENYPLIIVPEWEILGEGIKEWLLDYARNGGSLLLSGPDPILYFKNELGIQNALKKENQDMYIENQGRLCYIKSDIVDIEPTGAELSINEFYSDNDLRYKSKTPSSMVIPFGTGKIGLICFNLGENYYSTSHFVTRDFLSDMIGRLMEDPVIKVEGSHLVHVTLNRLDDRLLVNLINTAGNHANPEILGIDEIPRIGPLKISVRSEKSPSSVIFQPGNKKISFRYEKGKISFEIPELELYSIVEIR